MWKPDVVTNAGPLIYLSLLGRLNLLHELFGQVWVADAVYQEVVAQGKGRPGASETETAFEALWLQHATVQNRSVVQALLADLDLGEAETIAVARELDAGGVLMDDRAARARAQMMGLRVTGTIGVLLLAQESGMTIDLRRDLDALIQSGFRLSPGLYRALLTHL